MKRFFALTVLLALAASAYAGEAAFTKKPTATKAGDKVKISFAVSAPVDVEVSVLDSKGETVRHLGGGLLGDNSPEPFAKGLSQEVEWDGLDDGGKKAAGGPFKVSVGLGLAAEFDQIIGWAGQRMDAVRGMAVASDGTLYVLHGAKLSGHRRTSIITAYDREGRYLGQVFPSPGGLPAEKRKGWPHVALDGGAEVPVIQHVLTRCVHPGAYFGDEQSNMVATDDGRVIALSSGYRSLKSTIKHSDVRGGRRLLMFAADGSAPEDFLGPVVVGEKVTGKAHLALSPDGKYVYAAGFGGRGYYGKKPLENVVYRVAVDGSEKSAPFIGKLNQTGLGETGLNDPRGLDVDKEGNIYVADVGNKRVAVFKADGKYLGEIPAEGAVDVRVSSKTGAVYVRVEEKLVKFGGLKDPAKKAECPFPRPNTKSSQTFLAHMALDDSGEKPVLYLTASRWIKHAFGAFQDLGDRFEPLGNIVTENLAKDEPGLPFVNQVAVVDGKVISAMPRVPDCNTSSMAYDAKTGKYLGLFNPKSSKGDSEKFSGTLYHCGGEMSAGKDGRLYVQTGGFMYPAKNQASAGTLRRYESDGSAAPFEAVGQHFIKKFYQGHHRQTGRFATTAGDIYVAAFPGYRGRDQEERGQDVHVIGPDGSFKKERLVHIIGATGGGLAVGPRGNIYLGVQVHPKGKRHPPWFEGKLPENSEHEHPGQAYDQHGAIVKFPPEGGRIFPDPESELIGRPGGYAGGKEWKKDGVPVKFENVLWYRRAGYIAINSGHEVGCQCENTRFDVDQQGRLFVPDLYRFQVSVMDAAGNDVTAFGGYGNMDNRGPESDRPDPAIPYGWPIGLQVYDGKVYVADLNNRRIVVTRLECRVTETCDVR